MFYIWQHVTQILSAYKGELPFHLYSKKYCSANPKLGSRDRKMIAEICYAYFRTSKGFSAGTSDFKSLAMSCLNSVHATPHAKLFADVLPLNQEIEIEKLFPFELKLSEGISKQAWLQSMLVQPSLFIRVRKQKAEVLSRLKASDIEWQEVAPDCLKLPNSAKIDALLPQDWYVIQDASSQATGSFFTPKAGEKWLDTCSGAGGKSLLLLDKGVKIDLTVADIRDTILHNLKQRFSQYNYKVSRAVCIDVSKGINVLSQSGQPCYDQIICDVPCSGSGTWSRTPEQLYFFESKQLEKFPPLQAAIAKNATKLLKKGGKLYYITCSVFEAENECVVKELLQDFSLECNSAQIINGISQNADSMFIAVLEKK